MAYKYCDVCKKKRMDSSFIDGEDTCKFCKDKLEKEYNSIGGLFEENLVTCPNCGEQKRANLSNFRGGKSKKTGEFRVRSLNCNDCIEKEYYKIDNNLHEIRFKKCRKCGKEFPNTLDYYKKNYRNRDFLEHSCKDCLSKIPVEKRKDVMIGGVKHTLCRECKKLVPRTEFPYNENTKSITRKCKSCIARVKEEIQNGTFRVKGKVCPECGEYKELKEFTFAHGQTNYTKKACKACSNKKSNEYKRSQE